MQGIAHLALLHLFSNEGGKDTSLGSVPLPPLDFVEKLLTVLSMRIKSKSAPSVKTVVSGMISQG